MEDRIITSTKGIEDADVENVLRPTTMDDSVGQEKVKKNLKVYIKYIHNKTQYYTKNNSIEFCLIVVNPCNTTLLTLSSKPL